MTYEKSDRPLVVRVGIADGLSDEELATEMGISVDEVAVLRAQVMKDEVDRYGGSPEETFALTAVFMSERVEELGRFADKLEKSGKQGTAFVAARKAQVDIHQKIIAAGERAGVIKTSGDGQQAELVGLPDEELAAEIHRRLESVTRLRSSQLGVPITEVTIEPPGRIPKQKKARKPKKPKRAGVSKIKRKASLPRTE